MTAINMFCQPRGRAGYIVADCAVLDTAGIYREACSKVVVSIGRFPFAIGITGNIHPHRVIKVMGDADLKSIKQLVRHLPEILHRAMEAGRESLNGLQPMLALKGVAWDFARKAPVGFVITSDPAVMPGSEPFVFYETAWNFTRPASVSDAADLFGEGVDPTDPAQFDPDADGLRTIETVRQMGQDCLIPGMEHVRHTVGGEAQIFTVTRRGVVCHCLREWPDEIGRPLDPHRSPAG